LAVITFVGATDLAETESSLKAMWDVIHPKSGSNVRFWIYLSYFWKQILKKSTSDYQMPCTPAGWDCPET
jgi:hypothetical protein